MLLAGDIGGTKILLGLFEPGSRRPRELITETYRTADAVSLETVVREFLDTHLPRPGLIAAAAFGVAGPVLDGRARLTNVPWLVDVSAVVAGTGIPHVGLLNDLEALATSIPVLDHRELEVLQAGAVSAHGNAALIAAGTGLGEALLVDRDGRLMALASEGGHADFAARTDREAMLTAALTRWYGRATWEAVLSGPGLVNIYRFAHDEAPCPTTRGIDNMEVWPARITRAALARECPACVETLDLFVAAYGAEAGNMALRAIATRGVFIGGGIAPKILPALTSGAFMAAFRAKQPMGALVDRTPVKVILNPRAALLGSAVHATGLMR